MVSTVYKVRRTGNDNQTKGSSKAEGEIPSKTLPHLHSRGSRRARTRGWTASSCPAGTSRPASRSRSGSWRCWTRGCTWWPPSGQSPGSRTASRRGTPTPAGKRKQTNIRLKNKDKYTITSFTPKAVIQQQTSCEITATATIMNTSQNNFTIKIKNNKNTSPWSFLTTAKSFAHSQAITKMTRANKRKTPKPRHTNPH